MKTTITHAAIILADAPYIDYHPHQHHGKHFYIIVSNAKACAHSPVLQATRQGYPAKCFGCQICVM